jgi:hypothetical protein
MDTQDVLIIALIGVAAWLLFKRSAAPAPRALVPSVTTEEFYYLPYYLDINSGLFDAPGAGLVNQNVSQGIPL